MGNINRTENQLENRVVNEIHRLAQQQQDFKNSQPIGADVVQVQSIPEAINDSISGGPLTLTAGSSGGFKVTFTPPTTVNTLWYFQVSLSVDGNAYEDRYPDGTNLTSAKRAADFSWWPDYLESNDQNTIVVIARIHNRDVGSHNYYVDFKAFLPKLAGTGGS